MIGADGRADGGQDVYGIRSIAFLHGSHSRTGCATHRSQPAGMDDSNYPFYRVIQQNRCAICKAHEERHLRIIGQHDIGFYIGCIKRARHVGVNHIRTMDLPDIMNGLGRTSQRLERTDAILTHVSKIIANRAAHVERIPWVWADATLTGKNRLGDALWEDIKCVVTQTVLLGKGHKS